MKSKDDFINRRTEIISRMLDNPNEYKIYPTGKCFAELDDLFDEIVAQFELPFSKAPSGAQKKELKDE